jgi:hypothetical protein
MKRAKLRLVSDQVAFQQKDTTDHSYYICYNHSNKDWNRVALRSFPSKKSVQNYIFQMYSFHSIILSTQTSKISYKEAQYHAQLGLESHATPSQICQYMTLELPQSKAGENTSDIYQGIAGVSEANLSSKCRSFWLLNLFLTKISANKIAW